MFVNKGKPHGPSSCRSQKCLISDHVTSLPPRPIPEDRSDRCNVVQSIPVVSYHACHLSILRCGGVVVSSLSLWNPNHSPRMPPGFGTGHGLLSCTSFPGPLTSSSGAVWPKCAIPSRTSGVSFLFHLRLLPFSSITTSPSAKRAGGTGQGRTCGRPTTKKLAKTVTAKRVEVVRERGWRCGGMAESRMRLR